MATLIPSGVNRMKTILLTGISGTQVQPFTDELNRQGNEEGTGRWHHIRYARLMYDCDPERSKLTYAQWEDSILKRKAALPHLRSAAFDRLLQKKVEIENKGSSDKATVCLISTHATFWYGKTLLPGLELGRLNELEPNMFVTIVDDVIDVWNRLLKTNQLRWQELSPVDILEWREIETFVTEQMAELAGQKGHPLPFFIIAHRYKPTMLHRLISNQDIKRIYMSYPITFVQDRPEVKSTVDKLIANLNKFAVVYNPMGIQDYDRRRALKKKYNEWCIKKGYSTNGPGWEDIEKHLSKQTVSRDHRLIDQSHALVVYYPELKYFTKEGEEYKPTRLVPFSSGVLDEMQYATQRGKDVYLVWTSKRDPGPFLPTIYTKLFRSTSELVNFFKNSVLSKSKS